MAVAKSNQELKREKKREKRMLVDKITNRYMINLMWGIVGIVALRFVENGFASADTILKMPTIMKVLAGVFAVLAVALFVCGKAKIFNNSSRWYHYGAFSIAIGAVSLWIGFYAKIRLFVVGLVPALSTLDSRWWITWGIMALVVIYLVVELIRATIKVAMIEKGKKNKF